ncbi:MAG TPA: GDSL-type esterase/lipase family protein [Vicinamibacterales bacterium]|nr:GDSL-type esterase/lipase family protein [Vicinamibacterales bacterium]
MGLSRGRKLLFASLALIISAGACMIAIELWVRMRWDDKQGRPGFFLTDANRGQRLSPGYDGWFAGVPVRINSMGFRDRKEYSLEKSANTFRILVLGDSVTFGHGTLDETTYPYLLEQQLRKWRPDVKWEVWNLGVPGYNTGQELAYLEEIGPRAQPDLVIVGFYPNDFSGDNSPSQRGVLVRSAAPVLRFAQRHLYSFEFYKRVYLTARFRLFTSKEDQQRLEHLASEEELLQRTAGEVGADVQRLTALDRIDEPNIESFTCPGRAQSPEGSMSLARQLREHDPEYASWFRAVEAFQALHQRGAYRIMFFINMAPWACEEADRFVDGGRVADDDALLEVMGKGTPAASSTRAFFHYRPSQMPAAGGHAIGNSNFVKAETLADYLEKQILPPLLPAAAR